MKSFVENTFEQDAFICRDGMQLWRYSWLPAEESEAVVVMLHGIFENGGHYDHVAEALNERGHAVHALDLRGHGRSEGQRILVYHFERLLDDVEDFLECVRERHPGKKIFLFGHSLGALVAIWLTISRSPDIDGLMLSAPTLSIGGKAYPLLRSLVPWSNLLIPPLQKMNIPCPLIERKFPLRTGAEIVRAAVKVSKRMEKISLPVLIMHGKNDTVTLPQGSRMLYRRSSSTDKTLKLYDHMRHAILKESDREKVIGDMLDWVDSRASSNELPEDSYVERQEGYKETHKVRGKRHSRARMKPK